MAFSFRQEMGSYKLQPVKGLECPDFSWGQGGIGLVLGIFVGVGVDFLKGLGRPPRVLGIAPTQGIVHISHPFTV
ncbi:unknown [Acidaminococcus intestini CAG:325]|nr:unknown [Acidaminococcus intestini CAG:325]